MDDIRFDLLTPPDQIKGDDARDTAGLKTQHKDAKNFLSEFTFVQRIQEEYFGGGVGTICSVSLFKITNEHAEDEFLWVIAGDIPPAHIMTEDTPTPAEALQVYIGLMDEWCEAVMNHEPVDDLIPVNAPPTKKWAKELHGRLRLLEKLVLPHMPGYDELTFED